MAFKIFHLSDSSSLLQASLHVVFYVCTREVRKADGTRLIFISKAEKLSDLPKASEPVTVSHLKLKPKLPDQAPSVSCFAN